MTACCKGRGRANQGRGGSPIAEYGMDRSGMRRGRLAPLGGVLTLVLAVCACAESGETPLATVRVATGLGDPLYVTHAPGDRSRIFIVERLGGIRIVKDGVMLPDRFLDVAGLLTSRFTETGLLGLAFHPDYDRNGYFYVNYTSTTMHTVIARYQVSPDPDVADPNTSTVMLTFPQPADNHNGGWIDFGPDGYLYVSTGDGGGQRDPDNRAQDTTDELLGKILRIDVDGDDWPDDPIRNYRIPPGNPFVGQTGDDEIWAYGLRNPWRCAFDSATGDLFIADVGQDALEEINWQPSDSVGGENYGWRCMEGAACTGLSGCTCHDPSLVLPVYEYTQGGVPDRCSITGGEVYRGCAIPDLRGTYFFADFCSDQIWTFRHDHGVVDLRDRTAELAPGGGLGISSISSFGRDADGELYICDLYGHEVFKIVPAAVPPFVVAGSDPSNGAIDARQPSEPDGSAPAGWSAVTFAFDGPAPCPDTAAFDVTQSGADEPPLVVAVDPVGDGALRVVFDRPIAPGQRVTVTHLPSGGGVEIGFLPGDVDGDAASTADDVIALIEAVTDAGEPRATWSTDVNRSGATGPHDVLRLIDLLNGAGVYEAYIGASLP